MADKRTGMKPSRSMSLQADTESSSSTTTNNESNITSSVWEGTTENYFKQPSLRLVISIAVLSAKNPKRTVALACILSVGLVVTGIFTNFRFLGDGEELWAPFGTQSRKLGTWVAEESGFQADNNGYLAFLVHNDGSNVLTFEGANCLFDAVDTIRSVEGYHQTCYESWGTEDKECPIVAASGLSNHNRSIFFESFHGQSDKMIQLSMSRLTYPNGQPVVRDTVFGYPEPKLPDSIKSATQTSTAYNKYNYNEISNLDASKIPTNPADVILTSATSFLGLVPKSESDEYDFEIDAVRALYDLQDQWDEQGIQCSVEANSYRALDDESKRGVEKDIPMMALAFVFMGILCALYLSNFKNFVHSRAMLGLGAIATILLSVMTSYGILFMVGVPFTGMAQLFLYVMIGIGLDDTFIITGAYFRTDPKKDSVERVEECMREVGVSIVVSTLTTVVAFSSGFATSMPMIRWFCNYAAPTVLIDFFFQISVFVALMVLDDRRIRSNRLDCLVCVKSKGVEPEELAESEQEQGEDEQRPRQPMSSSSTELESTITKWMSRYCDLLLRPQAKAFVLVLFSIMTGLGIYGATEQTRELDFRDMMPPDSFIRTYYGALHEYSSEYSFGLLFLRGEIYFRDVDVSDPKIQKQMNGYVNDVVSMPYISSQPEFFWLRHFWLFEDILGNYTDAAAMSFNDKLTIFLQTHPFDVLYAKDIVRDKHGNVTASRCQVIFDQGSNYDVDVQIDSVNLQRQITSSQSINAGKSDLTFFMFTKHFYAWELHDLMFKDLMYTLVLGLVSVLVISLLFIPHPFGALVLPLIVGTVYCQLMAFLKLAGIHINVVSAIGLIMSIGLVVDYNMHVALAFYETKHASISRDEKVRKVLTTMGASIMVGGLTTMTSALPLGLTGSLAFRTFFFTFLAIPVLGLAHGLILLPVILSLWGPHAGVRAIESGESSMSTNVPDPQIPRSDSLADDQAQVADSNEVTSSEVDLEPETSPATYEDDVTV